MTIRRRKLAIRYRWEWINVLFGGPLYRDMNIWLPRESA